MATRNQTLAWLVMAAVPAFVLTGTLTAMYREHERALAVQWKQRADRAIGSGDHAGAVVALQSALRFAPGDRTYTFALARALVSSSREAEARAYLRRLWELEPGSGPVNLELGRIAAGERDTDEALRYYHNAIDGSWREAPEMNRREARLELATYLVKTGDLARAQAELLLLAADPPEEPSTILRIGRLLLAARSPGPALEVFAAAPAHDRPDPALLTGAGDAAYELGEYATAVSYYTRARAAGADPASFAVKAEVAAEVLRRDPFQRRLPAAARARRALAAFERAAARLDICPPAAARHGATLETLRPRVTARALGRDSELVEHVMDVVYRVEATANGECSGTAQPADTALLLIGRRQFGS